VKRLFIYFAGIGDLVLFVPLFRRLAAEGSLDLVTRPFGELLFEGQSFVGRTYGLRHPNRGRSGLARRLLGAHRQCLGRRLAAQRYDEIFLLRQERTVISDWVDGWRGTRELRAMDYPDGVPGRLVIGLRSIGMDPDEVEPCPRLDVSEAARCMARDQLAALGRRVVGVQMGSGPVNVWLRHRTNLKSLTVDQWAGLITSILEAGEADAIVFHGSAPEARDVAAVVGKIPARWRDHLHNWAGKLGIARMRVVLAESYALLSADTGPAHIAAAVACPLLVFFGPSNPDAYLMKGRAPVEMVLGKADCQFCTGTPRFKSCRDNICLNALSPDALVAGWRRLRDRISH